MAADHAESATPQDTEAATAAPSTHHHPLLHARIHKTVLILFIGYLVLCLVFCLLLLYQRHYKRLAAMASSSSSSSSAAARKILLPALEPLLYLLTITTLLFSLFFALALSLDLYHSTISTLATEVFYSGRQFVFLSVVLVMLQPGVSSSALYRTVVGTLFLASYTIPIVFLLVKYCPDKQQVYTLRTLARALLLLLYGYAFFSQPHRGRASKRALSEFCAYAAVYFALLFAYNDLFQRGHLDAGFAVMYANLIWGTLCPLVIWRVLLADTEHWRRLGQRAVSLQRSLHLQSSSSSTATTTTTSLWSSSSSTSASSSAMVTRNGDRLLQVELHHKHIIDFAHLQVSTKRIPSSSTSPSSSNVYYHGVLCGATRVAVQVFTPEELTEDVVAHHAQQAALCGALPHDNIVRFLGLCVAPPHISMVFELCTGGTLEDVAERSLRQRSTSASHPHRSTSPRELLTVAYLLDAARAVAFLHSFTPAFVHGDLRPSVFVVDDHHRVKLSGLGEISSSPSPHAPLAPPSPQQPPLGEDVEAAEATLSSSSSSLFSLQCSQRPLGKNDASPPPQRTTEFSAPERFHGATKSHATDIYALGVTLKNVLHRSGEEHSTSHATSSSLQELLAGMCHDDPSARPSATQVVEQLTCHQEQLARGVAVRLATDLYAHRLLRTHPLRGRANQIVGLVEGHHVGHLMILNQYVEDENQSLRLGNVLIEAHTLHHLTPKSAFEMEDPHEWYYFDHASLVDVCGDDGGYYPAKEERRDVLLDSTASSQWTASSSASSTRFQTMLAMARQSSTSTSSLWSSRRGRRRAGGGGGEGSGRGAPVAPSTVPSIADECATAGGATGGPAQEPRSQQSHHLRSVPWHDKEEKEREDHNAMAPRSQSSRSRSHSSSSISSSMAEWHAFSFVQGLMKMGGTRGGAGKRCPNTTKAEPEDEEIAILVDPTTQVLYIE